MMGPNPNSFFSFSSQRGRFHMMPNLLCLFKPSSTNSPFGTLVQLMVQNFKICHSKRDPDYLVYDIVVSGVPQIFLTRFTLLLKNCNLSTSFRATTESTGSTRSIQYSCAIRSYPDKRTRVIGIMARRTTFGH
jgi:hypothetical protein